MYELVRFWPDHFFSDLIKFIIDVLRNGTCIYYNWITSKFHPMPLKLLVFGQKMRMLVDSTAVVTITKVCRYWIMKNKYSNSICYAELPLPSGEILTSVQRFFFASSEIRGEVIINFLMTLRAAFFFWIRTLSLSFFTSLSFSCELVLMLENTNACSINVLQLKILKKHILYYRYSVSAYFCTPCMHHHLKVNKKILQRRLFCVNVRSMHSSSTL